MSATPFGICDLAGVVKPTSIVQSVTGALLGHQADGWCTAGPLATGTGFSPKHLALVPSGQARMQHAIQLPLRLPLRATRRFRQSVRLRGCARPSWRIKLPGFRNFAKLNLSETGDPKCRFLPLGHLRN